MGNNQTGHHRHERHGYGTFTFTVKDGDVLTWAGTYEGEWKENLKSGTGTYSYPSGDRYSGQWLNDKRHYVGTHQFANKDVFRGEFLHGMMHGTGVYTYSNGDRIVGRWQEDVQDGISVFRAADGSLREEQWESGERMTSRPIGTADPLAISAELDAERVLRKAGQDLSQFHLIHKQLGSMVFESVSPMVAPRPPAETHEVNDVLEQLARIQASTGAGNHSATKSLTPVASPPSQTESTVTVGDTPIATGESDSTAASSSATASDTPNATDRDTSSTSPNAPSTTNVTHKQYHDENAHADQVDIDALAQDLQDETI